MNNTITDVLDILDFANTDAPTFVTQVGTTLVLTPAACFTGTIEAWAAGHNIERRNLFLGIGNAHLAEVQLQRLGPEGRQHALDHLPEQLPVHDPVMYTRTITAAIRDVPPDVRPELFAIKGSRDELEGYRRCLLIRAAAYGGPIDGMPVFALSMGIAS